MIVVFFKRAKSTGMERKYDAEVPHKILSSYNFFMLSIKKNKVLVSIMKWD